jgi:hypothetical protein
MKTLKMTRVFATLHQKAKFGWSDFVFATYTAISWTLRILTPSFIKDFHWFSALEITLGLSIFLTFLFILISNLFKVDWYGKKGKSSLIPYVLNLFSENISKKKLLFFLFFLDPFLFFIYYRNGNHGFINIVKRWVLLFLSLSSVAFMWLGIGLFINLISWPIFLFVLFLILGIAVVIFRKKIFKKS